MTNSNNLTYNDNVTLLTMINEVSAIKGKIACVTGAVSGLGFEMAKYLVRSGLKGLVIADLNEKKGLEAVKQLSDYGEAEIKFLKVDLTCTYQVDCMLLKTVDAFKHLDILINNAGVVSEKRYELTFKVNYIAVLYGTMLAMYRYMPKYKTGDEGIVVNIASIFGLQPGYTIPAYSTSKFAVVGIGRTFGTNYYYNRYKVKVLTMCPGFTATSLTEKKEQDFDYEFNQKELSKLAPQRAKFVGRCLLKMLEDPKNGSVWISEAEECYEYPIEKLYKLRYVQQEKM